MLKASTYFIKGQSPGVPLQKLLEIYQREILAGGAEYAVITDNMVRFSGTAEYARPRGARGAARSFSGFEDGELSIEETDTEFEVYLEGHCSRIVFLFDVFFETLRNDIEQELQR